MISDTIRIRPRYGEVDRMGYVYHSNYIDYCHQARTELMRKYGIDDHLLEAHNIMLPVISMNLRYFKPARYDEWLTVKTTVKDMPSVRFSFDFEIFSKTTGLLCKAFSTVAFVDSDTRKPIRTPAIVENALKSHFGVSASSAC